MCAMMKEGQVTDMRKKWGRLSLYHKFVLVIILAGLCPMLLLTTAVTTRLYEEYRYSVTTSQERAAYYIGESLTQMMDSWKDVSKMPYFYSFSNESSMQYNYMSFDNLRKILTAEGIEDEKKDSFREQNMRIFLRTIYNMDSSITGTYFYGAEEGMRFAYGGTNTYLENWDEFERCIGIDKIDTETRDMILIPTHNNTYYYWKHARVFTIARNYYDLTGMISNQPYLGTVLIDVDIEVISRLFTGVDFGEHARIYVYDGEGFCWYSNQPDVVGEKVPERIAEAGEGKNVHLIHIPENEYGLSLCIEPDERIVYGKLQEIRNLMYMVILMSVILLLLASVWFSRRLTRPVRNMMEEMSKLERGIFDVSLPVEGEDEISILSRRFNEMSQELKRYIDQSYLARIKQTEAEMTALKSQIYPHFLYNTLEVIRMTALEEKNREKVPKMIAALSMQIRYMIGTVQDMVPVKREVEITEKYVYLLNCRITGNIRLSVDMKGFADVMVPKLILQPIVENSYVHGLKPRGGSGMIRIQVREDERFMRISVMDDGIGMDSETKEELEKLLKSDAIGIKCEDNWQSIGLKNVHDRICYLYGESFGIKVTSQVNIGTMIEILMPCHKEGEAE